jgi:hypothetical protein
MFSLSYDFEAPAGDCVWVTAGGLEGAADGVRLGL